MKRYALGSMLIGLLLLCLMVFPCIPSPVASASASNTDATVQVESLPGPTVTQVVEARLHDSWPWYIIRASGLIAGVALVLLMLSGMGQITGHTYRFLPPLTAWASHRSLGIVSGIAIVIHMLALLFDHYSPFRLVEILVPWASSFKPATVFNVQVGSLYVALGIFAFYLTLVVVVTSLLWVERKPKTWKLTHFLSYIIMSLVFVHALFLGTDTSHGWMRVAWIGFGLIVAGACTARLWRARTV